MTPSDAHLVAHSAILHWPALPGPPPESLLRQLTHQITSLRSRPEATRDNLAVACELVSRRPAACKVTVSGDTAETALAELARLTLALVRGHRVVQVAWLDQAAVLDRETFLRALDPASGRPKRPTARPPAARRVPRMSPAQSLRVVETILRQDLCGPVDRSETVWARQARRAPQGDLAGRWVALGSVLATAAVLAANAGGAAAQAISSVGFF